MLVVLSTSNKIHMKKTLFILSSRNKNSSTTYYANFLKENISHITEISTIAFEEFDLKPCLGCKGCFETGKCPLDELDDGEKIKNLLLEANVIVLLTPVYAHNIPSDLKLFIDRISNWLHIFKLLGKKVFIITTADSNGDNFVNDYLKKIFMNLGCHIIKIESCFSYNSKDQVSYKLNEIVDNLILHLRNEIQQPSTSVQEAVFQGLKLNYRLNQKNKYEYEYEYWKNNGMFDIDDFETLIKLHKPITEK